MVDKLRKLDKVL